MVEKLCYLNKKIQKMLSSNEKIGKINTIIVVILKESF